MAKREDLVGKVFGRLTVVAYSHTTNKKVHWICQCACGACCAICASSLKEGNTTSCGCYQREKVTTHGMRDSSEYCVWGGMLSRCTNPSTANYSGYGGRGITVCPEWKSFEQFYADMGPRPSPKHSLDRIDNNGPYCKENCRWATIKEQCNNRRSSRMLTHNGEARTVSQWSEKLELNLSTLTSRLRLGWSDEKAITTPVREKRSNA